MSTLAEVGGSFIIEDHQMLEILSKGDHFRLTLPYWIEPEFGQEVAWRTGPLTVWPLGKAGSVYQEWSDLTHFPRVVVEIPKDEDTHLPACSCKGCLLKVNLRRWTG